MTVTLQDGSTPTLTSDDGGVLSQPLVTDAYGAFYFNAATQFYDLEYYYGGRLVQRDFSVPVGGPVTSFDVTIEMIELRDEAQAYATASYNSSVASAAQVSLATAQADRAEMAADAAALDGGLYDNAAAGRAAVADGENYAAVGADSDKAIDIWKRVDASNSTLLRSYPSLDYLTAQIATTTALQPFPPGHDVDLDRLEAPVLWGPGVRTDVSYRLRQFDNNEPGVFNRFYVGVQQTDLGTDNNPVDVCILQEASPRTGKTPLVVPPWNDSGVYFGAASVDCGTYDQFQASNGTLATAGINARVQIDTPAWKDAVRQTVGGGATTAPTRQIGTVLYTGMTEYEFDNSASGGGTFRTVFTIPAAVSRMRAIFALSNTDPINVQRAAIVPVATLAGVSSISNGDWTALTFSGAEGAVIPSRPNNNRRSYIASDWVNVASVARTDDASKLPLVAVAAYLPDEVNIRMLGNVPNDIDRTVWATHPDRPWISRYDTGDCVTTPADFTSTTNISNTPIIGLQYELVSGEVLTIGAIGDSITECIALGTTYPGASWAFETALDMQSPFLAVDCANIGWSGASASAIGYQWIDYLAFCEAYGLTVPSLVFCPNATPNSFSAPILPAEVGPQFVLMRDAMKQIKSAGALPIGWTIIPTNPANKDYGSSDIYRRDYNDEWRDDYAGAGITVADMDEVMAGVLDADGQMQIGVGLTSDNIHPNDAGIQAMASVAQPAVRSVAATIGFNLGTLVEAV
ncbi:SGNH/GDSL hydrolase family protein [Sphingomonas sp.]|uniref:SGNH/GDSL hydrolase family protein n=1 Tax=Sphingomonas sp. TaxID=28214 RepID=UPI0031DB2CAC